jgi:hypothetical protein
MPRILWGNSRDGLEHAMEVVEAQPCAVCQLLEAERLFRILNQPAHGRDSCCVLFGQRAALRILSVAEEASICWALVFLFGIRIAYSQLCSACVFGRHAPACPRESAGRAASRGRPAIRRFRIPAPSSCCRGERSFAGIPEISNSSAGRRPPTYALQTVASSGQRPYY